MFNTIFTWIAGFVWSYRQENTGQKDEADLNLVPRLFASGYERPWERKWAARRASFVSRTRSPFLQEFLCSLAGFLLFSLPYSFIFPLLQQDEPFVFFFWFAQYFFQITAKFQWFVPPFVWCCRQIPIVWSHISFVLVRSKTKENQIITQSRSLPAIVLLM